MAEGRVLLEVCVDTADGLFAAVEGGADRIELCSALELGGLTPSPGLMQIAASAACPVYAMVRPRGGGFVYSPAELDQMHRDIETVSAAGLAGIVIGANGEKSGLDRAALGALMRHRGTLGATLHRAIDLCPNMLESVDAAADLGFERILTSGGALNALAGLERLAAMHERANGRLTIMPGGGVSPDNVARFTSAFPVREIHASCSAAETSADARLAEFGFVTGPRRRTSAQRVRALRAALDAAS